MVMQDWTRRPTTWLPFLVSLTALVLVLGSAAMAGTAPHDEERAPARLFQVLILLNGVLIAVHAVRWLPAAPRQAAPILVAQVVAVSVPIAAILYLESRA